MCDEMWREAKFAFNGRAMVCDTQEKNVSGSGQCHFFIFRLSACYATTATQGVYLKDFRFILNNTLLQVASETTDEIGGRKIVYL